MNEARVPIVTVSTDPAFCQRVRTLVAQAELEVEMRDDVMTPLAELDRHAVDQLRSSDVQVVVLDLTRDLSLGLRFARHLSEASPTRTFVMAGPSANPELLLEAMRVGASEYLPLPVDDADLAAALSRALRRVGGLPSAPQPQDSGHVVTLFSAKGGTGVSTAAANLAVQLHASTDGSTVLVDLDVELGSAALYLGLHPRYSVMDVARNLHRVDRNLLASYVERHGSGIHVLASPAQPASGEQLTREQIRAILHMLRRQYEWVVVDLARALTPAAIGTFESSDHILLLTTPDLPSLRNTKKVLPTIDQALGRGADRIRVVLNRKQASDVISAADVARTLDRQVFASLDSDDERVGASLNEGRPVVLEAKSRYARGLRALTGRLAEPVTSTNGRGTGGRRGIGRLLRRSETSKKGK